MKLEAYPSHVSVPEVGINIIYDEERRSNRFCFAFDRKALPEVIVQVDYLIDMLKKINDKKYFPYRHYPFVNSIDRNIKIYISKHGIDNVYYSLSIQVGERTYFQKNISEDEHISPEFIEEMSKFYERLKQIEYSGDE